MVCPCFPCQTFCAASPDWGFPQNTTGVVAIAQFSQPAHLLQEEKQEKALFDHIFETLRGDGSVLIPVDTAGRVLELFLLLHGFWTEHK